MSSPLSQALIWGSTPLIFLAVIGLGLVGWNRLGWPAGVRWLVGLGLILAGNVVVWAAVFRIGWAATSGDTARLRTVGLYHWTRNPQYVADIAIFLGWMILSAAPMAWVPALGAIALLVCALCSEEPWLEQVYGEAYVR